MATLPAPPTAPSTGTFLPVSFPERLRIDRAAYHRMAEVGLLGPDAAVELLNGEFVPMSPVGYLHRSVVNDLGEFFSDRRNRRYRVSVQNPQAASEHSEPEPDVQLLRVRDDRYRGGHPAPEDVLLAIEVADSSLAKDTGPKMRIYAAAGVVEYWVVDLVNRRLLVHTQPDREAAAYRSIDEHNDQAVVAPACAFDCGVELAWLFGPPPTPPGD